MAGTGAGTGYFWLRRLHSCTGFLLSIAYVLGFLIPWSAAPGGPQAFNRSAAFMARLPFGDVLLALFVLLPLLFHAAVGLSVVYRSQFNVIAAGNVRNWMYAAQRISGMLLIPFVLLHLARTELAFAFTGRYADFVFVQKLLAPGWMKALYGVGVVCAAFHMGNGIAVGLMRWGIVVSRRAQGAAAIVMWIATLVLAAWGVRIVFAF